MSYDPDAQRFRDYAEDHSNDSPVDLSGREGAPRPRLCYECEEPLGTILGDLCVDCLTDRDLYVPNVTQGAKDEAIASDIDVAIDAVLGNFAVDVANELRRAHLNLLRELEQYVQEIHRSNSASKRDEMLVALKGLLNHHIIKELAK